MRWLAVVVAGIAGVVGAAVAQTPDAGTGDAGGDAAPQPPRWKSVQVLPADMDEAALRAVMNEMARGLRVKCTHCHEKDDPAAETPKKQVAREHLKMTVALQRDWFAGEGAPRVTCAMCHRGRAVPKP